MLVLNQPEAGRGLWLPIGVIAFCLALIGLYVTAMLMLPAPPPKVDQSIKSAKVDTGKFTPFSWPRSQQAAIGLVGYSQTIVSYNDEKPLPTASVAKVITALAVLKKKPLVIDQQGPTITLTQDDVDLYNHYRSIGGSVVKVAAGEEISQYQALQAMLLPSANNMAVTLANWAFGSEAEYVDYANKMLAEMGLKNTHVDDASGFSPKTVSTASELVLIGKEALKNIVLAQIVSQTEATVPIAGKISTTNAVMGQSGIKGIKTGHTAESGGCFLFAAERELGGERVTVVGAVLAAPTIEEARSTAPLVVDQAFSNVAQSTALGDLMPVATVLVPWSDPVLVVAQQKLSQTTWLGAPLELQVNLAVNGVTGKVGTGVLGAASTDLILQSEIPQPDIWWRITHPLELLQAL